MQFSDTEKQLLLIFIDSPKTRLITGLSTPQDLFSVCDQATWDLVQKILSLDPHKYGFKGPRLNPEKTLNKAVIIKNEQGNQSGEYSLHSNIYIPQEIYEQYKKMADLFESKNSGRILLLGSAYRSPAFQVVTLVYILVKVYDFNLNETLKRVALPDYSQHCLTRHTALDMSNIDGEPSDEEPTKFSESIEYKWLKENAHQFGFYESYPPENPDGIMWEPWHWQYRGN